MFLSMYLHSQMPEAKLFLQGVKNPQFLFSFFSAKRYIFSFKVVITAIGTGKKRKFFWNFLDSMYKASATMPRASYLLCKDINKNVRL